MTKNEIEVLGELERELERTYREAVRLISQISEKEPDEQRKAVCDQLESNCQIATQLTARIRRSDNTGQEEQKEVVVTKYLIDLGVPAHIKGYNYLRTAILAVMEDYRMLQNITKGLYPTVAKKYKTTGARVERAIRHAIEVSFDRTGNRDLIYKIFGNSISSEKGKPTNSAFIAGIADYVLQNHKFA